MELINTSEIEVTEIYEIESMGIFEKGLTTIDLNDVWRVREVSYKYGKQNPTGTLILFYEFDPIVVSEKYEILEETRRKYKADLIVKAVVKQIQEGE